MLLIKASSPEPEAAQTAAAAAAEPEAQDEVFGKMSNMSLIYVHAHFNMLHVFFFFVVVVLTLF